MCMNDMYSCWAKCSYIKPDMYNIVCNTNTTTNANEIKALTRVESE